MMCSTPGRSQRDPESLKIYKLIFAGLLTLSLLSHAAIVWIERQNVVSGYGDFVIFYSGAQIVNAGHGEELYDLSLQAKLQEQFKVEIRKGPLPYNHLPYELLLFLPLAKLPYPYAYGVWTLVNFILLVGVFKLLLPFVDSGHKILVGALLIAFYPTTVTLLNGQDSILSVFLMAAAFARLKRKRDAAAGVVLALGLYKPQLVLPIAAFLLLKRRWRAVFGFGITASVLAVISLAIVGWGGVINYFNLLAWMDRTHYAIALGKMANLRGVVATLIRLNPSSQISNLIVLMISVCLFAWSVYLWKGEWEPTKPRFDLAFSHMTVVSLLLSYHLYVYDLILLVIPLVLVANYVLLEKAQSALVLPAFLVLLLGFYCSIAAIWLLKNDLFAWAVIALISLALVLAKEISERNKQDNLIAAG